MLCTNASKILKSATDEVSTEVEFIDIMDPKNSEWFDKYCYDVPVLHIKADETTGNKCAEELKDGRRGIVAYNEGNIKFMHYFYKDKIINALSVGAKQTSLET